MGRPQTLETREKISKAMKGKPKSLQMRQRLSRSRKGMVFSQTHRNNISKSQKGKPGRAPSQETIEKIRRSNIGRKLSESHRLKLSLARLGKTPWNKGINGDRPLFKVLREAPSYKSWRKAVFERDGYTCQFCGTRGGILHADHIMPFALFPDLREEIDNGRTLCPPCHRSTDTYGSKGKTKNVYKEVQSGQAREN